MQAKTFIRCASLALVFLGTLGLSGAPAWAQGTAFTYQGHLASGSGGANGIYDLQFTIYNASSGAGVVAGPLTASAVAVSNGLFTVVLDPGVGVFTGAERWLGIAVRTNGAGAFTTLAPRQRITAAPYAVMSSNIAGTVAPASLPPGGSWALSTTLTLDAGTLAIDPVNNRVGIGTSFPAYPLHLQAGQSVARLDSTANTFGSVIELRNTTASPTYLGAINFNNAAGTYPGQIGYLATNVMVFRTGGAERMRLNDSGRLDITGTYSSVTVNSINHYLGVPYVTGISVTSDSLFNTAISASSDSGNALSASSSDGLAGLFYGAVQINYASPFSKPQLHLKDPANNGFSRLRMQTGTRPFWDIAVGGDNSLRFYADGNGDVVTLQTNGQLFVKVLTITGGADIVEPFQMSEPELSPGAVVVIDEANPGKLKLSSAPYDRRVAGVISGAGGVRPGLCLRQEGRVEGDQPVALTGRVYVQADTVNGPIQPGDLLTTSLTPGRAMKVTDHARAQGAILGKAMTGLAAGEGLVLVLVSLQ